MMQGVGLSPVAVGGQGQHANHRPGNARQPTRFEVRAVPTVVLKHEESHEEASGGESQEQGEPIADRETPIHESPRPDEEDGGVSHLPGTSLIVRAGIWG